jgi:protein involved in polysaccharide export with SLBB domain
VVQYLKNPDVTVSVLQVNSRTYNISGQVTHGGTFPLLKPTKVFEALNMAGSFLEFATRARSSSRAATNAFPSITTMLSAARI